jgi:hypothetical protein
MSLRAEERTSRLLFRKKTQLTDLHKWTVSRTIDLHISAYVGVTILREMMVIRLNGKSLFTLVTGCNIIYKENAWSAKYSLEIVFFESADVTVSQI